MIISLIQKLNFFLFFSNFFYFIRQKARVIYIRWKSVMIQERLGNTGQHDHPVSRFSTYGSGDRRASLGGGSRGSRRTTCTCVYTQWRENTGGWLTSPGKFFTFSLLLILIFHLPLLVPRVRTSFIDVVFLVQFVIVRYANRSIDTGRVQSFSDRDTDMGTGAILGEPAIGMREKRVDAKLYREDEVCNDFSCARYVKGIWKRNIGKTIFIYFIFRLCFTYRIQIFNFRNCENEFFFLCKSYEWFF